MEIREPHEPDAPDHGIDSRSADPPASNTPTLAQRFELAAIAAPRFAVPLLLALGAVLFLSNLGGYPLYTKGEPREAVTVFDIVHGGGVILPMRAGVEIPSKPLLMHWMAAVVSFAFGSVTELSVRLPSALLAIAGMLICYVYVRRLFDDPSGFLAAIFLGTSFQYLQAGAGARVDMTLTFFLELAFFEFIAISEGLTSRRMLLYMAISMAILAKGPVGLALPAIVGAVWIAMERRGDLLRDLRLGRGAIVITILGGGWYFAAIWLGGADFFRKQIIAENFARFVGGSSFHEGHEHPFYYLEFALVAGFMPWTFLILPGVFQFLRSEFKVAPRLRYLLVWSGVVLVFYSVAHSKRGVYLLAMYPALAAILAVVTVDALKTPSMWTRRFVAWIGVAAGVALLFAGIAALVALAAIVVAPATMRDSFAFWGITAPDFVPALASEIDERWILAALAPIAIEVLGFLSLRGSSSLQRLVAVITGAAMVGTLAANFVVVPAIASTLSLRNFAREMVNTVRSDPVGYLGALDYGVAFYSARNIPIVQLNDPDLPAYVICWQEIYDRMREDQKSRFTRVLTSNPTALDGSGAMVLLRRTELPPAPNSNSLQT